MTLPRTSSAVFQPRKPVVHSKTHRPPPLNNAFKQYTSSSHLGVKRASPGVRSPAFLRRTSSKSAVSTQSSTYSTEDDMTGLPQFCTMCEKQIITPGNSILYCSESCKRKDGRKTIEASSAEWCSPLTARHDSYFDLGNCPNLIPRQSPTQFPSMSMENLDHAFDSLNVSSTWVEAGIDSELVSCPPSIPFADYGQRAFSDHSLPSLSNTPSSIGFSPGSASGRGMGISNAFPSTSCLNLRSIELVLPFSPSDVEAAWTEDLHMKPCRSTRAESSLDFSKKPLRV